MKLFYLLVVISFSSQFVVSEQYVSSSFLNNKKISNQHVSHLIQPYHSNLDNDLDDMLKEIQNIESEEPQANEESNLADIFLRDKKNNRHRYDNQEPLTCSAKFKKENNVIVDSKASVNKGAELMMPIRYITPEMASKGLNALHDACTQICCETTGCDTALLSMKAGLDGYRCYLFKCNQNCFFLKHDDYVVMRMRTSEQLNDPEIPQKTTKISVFTNEPANQKTACHSQYEFTCKISGSCIPVYDVCNTFVDCDDKTDELDCKPGSRQSSLVPQNKKVDEIKVNEINGETVNKAIVDKQKNKFKLPVIEEYSSIPYEDELKLNGLDYDYLTLLQKQAEIVGHLAEVESKHSKHKSGSKNSDNDFKVPQDFFDSFMKTRPPFIIPTRPVPKILDTTVRSSFKNPIEKEKIYWHDNFDSEMMMGSSSTGDNLSANSDSINFTDKSLTKDSPGNIAFAVLILVMGISLVMMLFIYLILNTKYINKRISKLKSENKNVDVDGDYLINGMYL